MLFTFSTSDQLVELSTVVRGRGLYFGIFIWILFIHWLPFFRSFSWDDCSATHLRSPNKVTGTEGINRLWGPSNRKPLATSAAKWKACFSIFANILGFNLCRWPSRKLWRTTWRRWSKAGCFHVGTTTYYFQANEPKSKRQPPSDKQSCWWVYTE